MFLFVLGQLKNRNLKLINKDMTHRKIFTNSFFNVCVKNLVQIHVHVTFLQLKSTTILENNCNSNLKKIYIYFMKLTKLEFKDQKSRSIFFYFKYIF